MNVLVLGVGGNVSQSIQKALALATIPVRVIAACVSPRSPGLYVADAAYLSPLARSPDFIAWLIELCERERIDAILSGSEIVIETISPHADAIRDRTGAVAIVSRPEALATGRDKLLTCRWLQAAGLPVPGFADLADASAVEELVARSGFPLIAKPRFGKGSDGILRLSDRADLERAVAAEELALRQVVEAPIRPQDVIVQEYLGDDDSEFTAGCFCDRDGDLKGTIVLRRRLQSGTTVAAELGAFPEVREVAGAIAAELKPLGPCNVQLRLHHGEAVPFEINPRFSGTTALRARMGFNEVEAALVHFVLGEPVPRLEPSAGGIVLRYWNELYVPATAVAEITRTGHLDDAGEAGAEAESWGSAP